MVAMRRRRPPQRGQARTSRSNTRRINAAQDVDEVIVAYLEEVAARGGHNCTVALYDFDDQGQRQAVISRGRWSPQGGLRRMVERWQDRR